MYPQPRHMMPWAPRTAWDGWLAIAIFPPESAIRWIKAHFYRPAFAHGKTPLAAVEGFGETAETLLAWATGESVATYRREVETVNFTATDAPMALDLPGRFRLAGDAPEYAFNVAFPDEGVSATFDVRTGFPIWWTRVGRFLHYLGQHSEMAVTLNAGGEPTVQSGTGTLEHVMGAALPFDFTRALFSLHFHWDVLCFHTPDSPLDSAAGLALMRRGRTLLRPKAVTRFPGQGVRSWKGLDVVYSQVDRAEGPDGREIGVPIRWSGRMKRKDGVFAYDATAATPLAPLVPGGGMIGFDFAGTWVPSRGDRVVLSGTGFTEVGDFGGNLLALAR